VGTRDAGPETIFQPPTYKSKSSSTHCCLCDAANDLDRLGRNDGRGGGVAALETRPLRAGRAKDSCDSSNGVRRNSGGVTVIIVDDLSRSRGEHGRVGRRMGVLYQRNGCVSHLSMPGRKQRHPNMLLQN
jgi:hypothetical protein